MFDFEGFEKKLIKILSSEDIEKVCHFDLDTMTEYIKTLANLRESFNK